MQTLLVPIELLRFDLADRIRKAMRISGIGSRELANALEVSPASISNWLSGRNYPRPRDVKAIANITGVPLEWLLHGKTPTAISDEGYLYAPGGSNPEPTD